jgi:1-acyl-sn-glycerol-3-phosphate acyltransferase
VYPLIRFIAQIYVHAWYRVEVFGKAVPAKGPLLVCCNHTNGLPDAGLMIISTRRPLRFLAKYTVFSMPVVGQLARMANAIPVYRKKDGVPMERNQVAFEAAFTALRAGEAVCLFPEGESGTAMRVRPPLKTGIGRMGLGALQGHPDLDVRVLPLGVHIFDRNRFRSRIQLLVGEPFSIAGHAAAYEADPHAAVPALMAEIERSLRDVAPDLRDDADLPVFTLARRAWREDDGSHLPRLAALTRRLEEDRRNDPRAADTRAHQAATWLTRLGPEPGTRLGWLAGPVVLVAAILWALPTLMGRFVAGRFAPADKFVSVAGFVVPILGTLLVATAALVAGLGGLGAWTVLWIPGSWLLLAAGIRALDLWRGARARDRSEPLSQAREFLEPLDECPIYECIK